MEKLEEAIFHFLLEGSNEKVMQVTWYTNKTIWNRK
jgi:hypothetical protein